MGLKNGLVTIAREYNIFRKSSSSTYRVNTSVWSLSNSSAESEFVEMSDVGSMNSSVESGFFRGRFSRSSGASIHKKLMDVKEGGERRTFN